MKIFQIKENRFQQILILPTKAIKGLQKKGIIWVVKHVFVWCIIYEQHVANMNVKINRKEKVKVLVENWFIKLIRQEMQILHAKFLVKHSRNMYRDLCSVPNLIQLIIDIMMLGCRPNTHLELSKTFSKNSFNPGQKMWCKYL
jgi:hypothetical protein